MRYVQRSSTPMTLNQTRFNDSEGLSKWNSRTSKDMWPEPKQTDKVQTQPPPTSPELTMPNVNNRTALRGRRRCVRVFRTSLTTATAANINHTTSLSHRSQGRTQQRLIMRPTRRREKQITASAMIHGVRKRRPSLFVLVAVKQSLQGCRSWGLWVLTP